MNTLTKVAAGVGIALAVGGGFFAYMKLDDYWVKHYAQGDVLGVVTLDDGAMLAMEKIERERRTRDPNTDQVETRTEIDYRLRRYDQKSGNDLGRRLVGNEPTCVAADQGRAWCQWERDKAYLLDAKLEIVGEADELPSSTTRTPSPTASAAPSPIPAITISPMARANGGMFEVGLVGPDPRLPIHFNGKRGSKTLEAKRTYIAQGFLVDEQGNALAVPGALFLLHRTTAKPPTRHKLTRLGYDGKPAWTVDLPEQADTARLDGDTLVLVGRTTSVAFAVADGKQQWSTPHQQ
jgi:hypothetical protein